MGTSGALVDNFNRARPLFEAPDASAFFQSGQDAMDVGFRFQTRAGHDFVIGRHALVKRPDLFQKVEHLGLSWSQPHCHRTALPDFIGQRSSGISSGIDAAHIAVQRDKAFANPGHSRAGCHSFSHQTDGSRPFQAKMNSWIGGNGCGTEGTR